MGDPTILVAEDERDIRELIVFTLQLGGFNVVEVPNGEEAVKKAKEIKPDLIIETGIAHGGSLIMSASMLALIDYCYAADQKRRLDPWESNRRVLGIDIEIRSHNREAIETHPMAHLIEMNMIHLQ